MRIRVSWTNGRHRGAQKAKEREGWDVKTEVGFIPHLT